MSRLRKPIRALREPFGKAGLTVAILALVLAMVGGAYAAGGLTKSQEKQVTKIAKKYAGKPGATGPAGAAGANGKDGTNGTNGAPGAPGTNVTTKAIPLTGTGSATCKQQGGTEFTSASGTEKVCNGTTGFTENLPSGKTETGTWTTALAAPLQGEGIIASISFPIPLATPVPAEYVTSPTAGCPGTFEQPTAKAGHLCVYHNGTILTNSATDNPETGSGGQAAKYGILVIFENHESESGAAFGSWAVTAP